jgi:asparagine synthase (glutamine-hydrolysing)
MFSRARRLLDGDAIWEEIGATAALGHRIPSRSGRSGRVTFDETGDIALVVDGEVLEVGGSRVESRPALRKLLIEEYLARGPGFSASLNGFFSIAVVDRRGPAPRLTLACDRVGSLPIYYASEQGTFVFSSKLGLLARSGILDPEPDLEAAADLFAFSFFLGDSTPFRNIRCLPPGSTLVREGRSTEVSSTRGYFQDDRPFRSRSRCMDEILARFNEVVRHQVGAVRRTAIGLTGGLDSRAVASAAVKAGLRPASLIHTVPDATDRAIAEKVAESCGFEHAWVAVGPEGLADHVNPFLDITGGLVGALEPHTLTCLPALCDAAQIFVTGIGGEFARAFYWSKEKSLPRGNDALARLLFQKMNCVMIDDAISRRIFSSPDLQDARARAAARIARTLEALPSGLSPAARLDLFYLNERLRTLLIVKGTMVVRSAVEVRHPFLDGPLLELIRRTPEDLRRTSALHGHLISRNHPVLTRIPLAKTGEPVNAGYMRGLPWTILRKGTRGIRRLAGRKPEAWRPRGNYDYRDWTRGELGAHLGAILMDERTRDRGLFRPDGIRWLFEEHVSGARDHTQRLLALGAFELGLRLADEGRDSFREQAELERRIA